MFPFHMDVSLFFFSPSFALSLKSMAMSLGEDKIKKKNISSLEHESLVMIGNIFLSYEEEVNMKNLRPSLLAI